MTPQKEGYFFEPAETTYPGATQDMPKQNFRGQRLSFEISGSVQMPGVILKGLPGVVVSRSRRVVHRKVDYNWSGTVIPTKAGIHLRSRRTMHTRTFWRPQTNQDYTARIDPVHPLRQGLDKSGKACRRT